MTGVGEAWTKARKSDNGGGANYIRLCYSNVAESEISLAIQRLGRALERSVE